MVSITPRALAGVLSLGLSLCAASNVWPAEPANQFSDAELTNSIRRLFSDRCFICHGPDNETRATDLRLDRDDAVAFLTGSGKKFATPSDLKESEIWDRIHSTDPDTVMPPPSSKLELSEQQKELIRVWIERGATYKAKHWSFESLPAKIELPSIANSIAGSSSIPQAHNAIDDFIVSKLSTVLARHARYCRQGDARTPSYVGIDG
jgi:mono/diheme cytochrome c family protein